MRLTLSTGLASTDEALAGKDLYLLRCQLQFHPNDQARARAVSTPVWDGFLAQHQTTFDALTQGVVWNFATEAERDAVAASAREAVQAFIGALGVHTLTPLDSDDAI